MNGDEGAYHLSHLYDDLIQLTSSPTSDDVNKSLFPDHLLETFSRSIPKNTYSGTSRNTDSVTTH